MCTVHWSQNVSLHQRTSHSRTRHKGSRQKRTPSPQLATRVNRQRFNTIRRLVRRGAQTGTNRTFGPNRVTRRRLLVIVRIQRRRFRLMVNVRSHRRTTFRRLQRNTSHHFRILRALKHIPIRTSRRMHHRTRTRRLTIRRHSLAQSMAIILRLFGTTQTK